MRQAISFAAKVLLLLSIMRASIEDGAGAAPQPPRHATRRTAQVTPHQRPRVSFSRRRAAAPLPSPAFSSPPRAAATAAPSPEDGTPAVSSLYSSPPSVPHFVFFQIRALNC